MVVIAQRWLSTLMRNKNSWKTVCCIFLNEDTPLRSTKQIPFEFFKVSPSRVARKQRTQIIFLH